jgi:molecular chaperone GrpE
MNKPRNFQDAPKAANDQEPDASGNMGMPEENGPEAEILREAAQIASLHEEIAHLKDRYLRAVAETENLRRRADREKLEAGQFAFQRFALELLNVVDNFARAFEALRPDVRAALPPASAPVIEGLEATQRELLAILERNRIKRIEAKGQRFNPNLHEAIAEIPSSDVPAGHVIEVVQNGYTIGDRLLRPAMVAVAAQGSGRNGGANGQSLDTSA